MSRRLVHLNVPIRQDGGVWNTTDVRQTGSSSETLNDNRGAGDANMLLVGFVPNNLKPYNGVFRSYLFPAINDAVTSQLDNGWEDIKLIQQAYLSLHTRVKMGDADTTYPANVSYFETGSDAKVQMRRLTSTPNFSHHADGYVENITPGDPHAPDPSHWSTLDFAGITGDQWSEERWGEFVSPNNGGETRIRCTSYVGAVAPTQTPSGRKLFYLNPEQGPGQLECGGLPNHGVVLRSPDETNGDLRAEFYARRDGVDNGMWPVLVIVYEAYDLAPDPPRAIGPKYQVKPDFFFEGYLDNGEDNPIGSVTIEVRSEDKGGGDLLWTQSSPISWTWPDGTFLIDNPGQPTLPTAVTLYWRARNVSLTGKNSVWSNGSDNKAPWHHFLIDRDRPVVTPQPVGDQVQSWGMPIHASWTTP